MLHHFLGREDKDGTLSRSSHYHQICLYRHEIHCFLLVIQDYVINQVLIIIIVVKNLIVIVFCVISIAYSTRSSGEKWYVIPSLKNQLQFLYAIPHSVTVYIFLPPLLSLPILKKKEIGYIGDYESEMCEWWGMYEETNFVKLVVRQLISSQMLTSQVHQISWIHFERKLHGKISTLDQLYDLHSSLITSILSQ